MNCYHCLVETGSVAQPAFALCQRCGAGMCGQHLKELQWCPVAGLVGDGPRYSLICQRCYLAATPSARPAQMPRARQQKQRRSSGWSWWKKLWWQPEPVLPTEEDAVATVELFLKRQRDR